MDQEKLITIGKESGISIPFTDEFSDFIIIVEGKEIPVHRCVLAARSDKFRALFSVDMKEKANGVLIVDSYTYEDFSLFLEFLYSGSLRIPLSKCDTLLKIADEYLCSSLKKKIDDSNIFYSTNKSVELLELALLYKLPRITKSYMNFFYEGIPSQFKDVICNNPDFMFDLLIDKLGERK